MMQITRVGAPEPAAGDLLPFGHYALLLMPLWRRYLGIQRGELAQWSSVSRTMILYAERGTWCMRGRLVNKIAAALDVPASVLVAYTPDDERAQAYATRAAVRCAAWRLEHVKNEAA